MTPTDRCPVPGCTHRIPLHLFMCRLHWFKVPRPLRAAVAAAWNARLADPFDSAAEAAHEAAKAEALAAVVAS